MCDPEQSAGPQVAGVQELVVSATRFRHTDFVEVQHGLAAEVAEPLDKRVIEIGATPANHVSLYPIPSETCGIELMKNLSRACQEYFAAHDLLPVVTELEQVLREEDAAYCFEDRLGGLNSRSFIHLVNEDPYAAHTHRSGNCPKALQTKERGVLRGCPS